MTTSENNRVIIPSELIGSLPRSAELVEAQRTHKDGELTTDQLALLQENDLRNVLFELERTGSIQLTDGELTKPSFFNYPIYELAQYSFSFDDDHVITITYSNEHMQRSIPKLIKAPFCYATFAVDYLKTAQKYTKYPLKQAVIAPSVLSLVYTDETIENYSREQFLDDLINEAEKDVRQCLEAGADKVQLDLFSKINLNKTLLKQFIEINNRMLDRFNENEQKKLGVHVCSDYDEDNKRSSELDYFEILKDIFQLHLNNFYLQLSSEKDPERILSLISKLLQPHHRVFIGVINPKNQHVETAEEVRDQVLKAAKYIPLEQLGTTDDCGFSPYNDDESITREKCYDKIRARIQGTKLAEDILNEIL
ncbi:unnamed protein product [Adineta steineri]|uniref:Cobalamin-independent methionine synthase MetE C-terminal/archaeal domain-containing protein n=1 Tax=Adineta steineri TaxID=433720 RepID=A0A813X549_9BILA|nr:unnamed protein product [Adineta steineri]CAF3734915.1 unnamed protein product [Adineta steineri]